MKKKNHDIEGRLVILPAHGEAVILGDIHGDNTSLNVIIKNSNLENKLQDENHYFICQGDYIDARGRIQ